MAPSLLRSVCIPRALAVIGLVLGPGFACAYAGAPAARGTGIGILNFGFSDTSGEPADQAAAHGKRLQAFMAALRRDFATDQQYRLVPVPCAKPCIGGGPSPDLLHAAAGARAKILIVGGVHKESTLVEWVKVDAVDVESNRVVLDRLFTFRGDSDEAWNRAEVFVSQEIRAALPTQ
jgi:hypothetical protein